ncbi:MAG TPA: transketolase [Gemmatimonadaceae bacterium]|nr:transketolase [Gemmatimonadaceae bacterium]
MAHADAISADTELSRLAIDSIRVLAMDAVQKADSGHPGTPMALAPLAYVLWTRHLRHDPADPAWPDRDRFVLSCGHASMLLYSLLYLTGYGLTLDDLKQFRQWGSRTPGHPEYGFTPGVETTTGPLGQGMANAVGMAIAEAHLAARFNRPGHEVVNHHTWFIASDGDMMEGISHEAASYAGHLRLGKLIGFYDENHITIEGDTDLTFSDDTLGRFEAYGWHVQRLPDGNDLAAIDAAIEAARAETERPSLIIVRTHIGYGSPNKVDSHEAHGSPLGADEVRLTKENLGYPSLEPFYVPEEALAHWRETGTRGAELHAEWQRRWDAYAQAEPALAAELQRRLAGTLPDGWEEAIPTFTAQNGNVASRAASGVVLNAIAKRVPELIGGSADLAGSTNTIIKGEESVLPGQLGGRNFHFGIREHGMGSAMNGMSLHGGIIPYGATFLVFSDYMRPAIRLAALMHQRVVYVFTHDSIGLGEDGPTHQPIEQLTALRCIPNIHVVRPADASETAEAWRFALKHTGGPVALVLTRQKLGFIDRDTYASAGGLQRGAYTLADTDGPPDVVLLSSGSEVAIVLEARQRLAERGVRARVVSMPCHEAFAEQPQDYRDAVLPAGIPRVSIEAAHPMSWQRWVAPDGVALGLTHFGASAPYQKLYEELGMTAEAVVQAALQVTGR